MSTTNTSPTTDPTAIPIGWHLDDESGAWLYITEDYHAGRGIHRAVATVASNAPYGGPDVVVKVGACQVGHLDKSTRVEQHHVRINDGVELTPAAARTLAAALTQAAGEAEAAAAE